MRALTMDEVLFVSGGEGAPEFVVVTGSQSGGGSAFVGAGGVPVQGGGTGNALAESGRSVMQESAVDVIQGLGGELQRVVNGSDPEGDRLIQMAMNGIDGHRLGPSGRTGNWAYRTVQTGQGLYVLLDHLFNGTGSWDRVTFVPKNGSGPLTFNPGGFGGKDGYH